MIGSMVSFVIHVPKFGALPPKKIWGQKRAKKTSAVKHETAGNYRSGRSNKNDNENKKDK